MSLPSAHSKVGASSMYRWANCPGSVRLCATVPNVSSKYAEEGTEAHDLAAYLLRGEMFGGRMHTFKGKPVSDDMAGAVQVYVDHVRSLYNPSDTLLVEQGFHLKKIHSDLYGTADAVVWKPYSRHLHVVDYKHGAGVPVEVKGNPQLKYYALGALLESGFNAREVTVHIVQPRCPHPDGPIRSETFAAFDLLEWAADLLAAVKRTEDPDAPLTPGDHCRFCPAAAICPALAERATAMARLEFSPAVPYEPAKLKLALDSREFMKAWVKALDEFAYAEAMAGRLPPEVGYKLVEKRATRKWRDEKAAADTMVLNGLAPDLIYEEPAVRSPAQIEKLIGKKGFVALAEHVEKKSSGYTLAPESDNRPHVRVLDAVTEFTALAEREQSLFN